MYGFTPIGVIYLGIFWWSLSLLAFSYYRACTTSPGEPRDAMAEEQELLRVKSGMAGRLAGTVFSFTAAIDLNYSIDTNNSWGNRSL
jgi:hypothetical protein